MLELLTSLWSWLLTAVAAAPLFAVTPIVPATSRVAEKWKRRIQGAGADYESGVRQPRRSWQAGATAARDNFKSGVTAAAGRGAYEKGVARVGDAKWSRKATSVGVQRWGPGADAAEGDFSGAIGPFLEMIGRTEIPMKGPRGAAGNFQRSQRIGEALNKLRTGG